MKKRLLLATYWRRGLLVAVAILALVAASVAIALAREDRGPSHADLLNEPTKAREARPFTTQRDKRFDPYPLEREGHEE